MIKFMSYIMVITLGVNTQMFVNDSESLLVQTLSH